MNRKRLIRKMLRPAGGLALLGWHAAFARNYDWRKSIVVACAGRSGSTWLGEILSSQPGYVLLTEPLNLRHNPHAVRAGFEWETYIPPDAEEPVKLEYLRRVISGDELCVGMVAPQDVRWRDYLRFEGYTVKIARANMLLAWFLRRIPVRTVLMIRHPCAVVLSQLRHPSWNSVNRQTWEFPTGLAEDFPQWREIYDGLRSREEVMAFCWAVQSYLATTLARPYVHFLTYEQLVRDGRAQVQAMFDYLRIPAPEAAFGRLSEPSKTTKQGSNVATGKDPLVFWKEKLSTTQIDQILATVRAVGVTCYGEDLMPDLASLAPRPVSEVV